LLVRFAAVVESFVEQDNCLSAVDRTSVWWHAKCGGCGAWPGGLLDESFGCGGPTLASELGQSQLFGRYTETRVPREHFDYSNRSQTVSNPNLGAGYGSVSGARNSWRRLRQPAANRRPPLKPIDYSSPPLPPAVIIITTECD
jgi:hypothetical protein